MEAEGLTDKECMMRIRPLFAISTVLLFGLAACSEADGPTSPVSADAGPQMTRASSVSPLTASATGSGHVLTNSLSNIRKFTISAHEDADGVARGQYDLQLAPIGFFQDVGINPPLLAIHGTVSCVTVIGNSAYIGATVDRVQNTEVFFGPAPLTGAAIELIDNDHDPNTPDMISSVFVYQEGVPNQGTPEGYCANPVPGTVFPIEVGNIRVR